MILNYRICANNSLDIALQSHIGRRVSYHETVVL